MLLQEMIERAESRRLTTAIAAAVFCVVSHTLFFVAYLAASDSPDVFYFLFAEDHLVEWLGALVFLTAGVFAFRALVIQPPGLWRDRIALVVIGLVGVVGFLDEISFGDRIFELDMPVMGGVRVDALHDLLNMGEWIRWHVIGPVSDEVKLAAVLALVLTAGGLTWLVYRFRHALFDRKAAAVSLGMLGLTALILLKAGISFSIDYYHDVVGTEYLYSLHSIEEVAEFNIAVLVYFAYLMIRGTSVSTGAITAAASPDSGLQPHVR